MKAKGLIVASIILVLITNTFVVAYGTDDSERSDDTDSCTSIQEEFDSMFCTRLDKIQIDGEETLLLREFDSQDKAIRSVKKRCVSLLKTLQICYNLEELSEDNWEQYRDAMIIALDDDSIKISIDEGDYEYRYLRSFFDIFENKYKNDIVRSMTEVDKREVVIDDGVEKTVEEVLAENLPYDSTIVARYYSTKQDNTVDSKGQNTISAVRYATKHATNPNTSKYYYFLTGDCANFVSQILENSGTKQIVTNNVNTGWWHKYKSSTNTHTHSKSWTFADNFVRKMGISVASFDNHKYFTTHIKKGSVIAADYRKDRDWDHVGFVSDKKNSMGSLGYYDYKVAQHTRNYHDWASGAVNNWEKIAKDGGAYARVRNI